MNWRFLSSIDFSPPFVQQTPFCLAAVACLFSVLRSYLSLIVRYIPSLAPSPLLIGLILKPPFTSCWRHQPDRAPPLGCNWPASCRTQGFFFSWLSSSFLAVHPFVRCPASSAVPHSRVSLSLFSLIANPLLSLSLLLPLSVALSLHHRRKRFMFWFVVCCSIGVHSLGPLVTVRGKRMLSPPL